MADLENAERNPTDYSRGYSADVDTIREQEYPWLSGTSKITVEYSYILTSCLKGQRISIMQARLSTPSP